MSHRGKEFIAIAAEAEACCANCWPFRRTTRCCSCRGGAIGENAIVPMNLMVRGKPRRLRRHRRVVQEVDQGGEEVRHRQRRRQRRRQRLHRDPAAAPSWKLDPDAAYVHICSNETIGGVGSTSRPTPASVPLVADMSSDILSRAGRRVEVRPDLRRRAEEHRPAGLTIVIVRDDLIGQPRCRSRPSAFNYRPQAEADSMLNTPPTYAIYIAGLVFQWLKAQGGLAAMERTTAPRRSCCTTTSDATFLPQPGGGDAARDERALQA